MRRLEDRSRHGFGGASCTCSVSVGSARTSPSRVRACDSIRAFADSLESCELRRFVSARSWIRSRPSSSSWTFSCSTATLTATTPASRTATRTIQTTPPNGRGLGAARATASPPRPRDRRRLDACGSGPAGHQTFTAARSLAEAARGFSSSSRALGPDRLARQVAQHGLVAAVADRELRRAGAAAGLGAEVLLDDPVLERVEADDGDAASGPEHPHRRRERCFERAELVVDRDPQRLEDTLGGMAVAEAGGRRDRLLDRVGEVGRPLERPLGAAADDRPRDLPRVALLAEALEDQRELALVGLVHELARRELGRGVHAHVERRVGGVREAALRPVELHRRDAEVEQDCVRLHVVGGQLAEDERELAAQEASLHRSARP